jgi:TP901 family phage tail tape measure protein
VTVLAGTAYIDVLPRMTKFVGGIQAGLAGMRGRLSSLGSTLTKGLTLPIVGAGAAAIHLAGEFEASMDKIYGLVGASHKQVEEYSDAILALAGDLPQAPKELADALFFVTSAGFEGAEALDVLESSARAAAAGLGETKVVADAVTSAVNVYGIEALSAADSTDILLATVREGKVAADSLAPAIGRVIPLAQAVGIEFDEVGGSIASLTRTGYSAALAVTGLSGIIRTLIKPAQSTSEALDKIGWSVDEFRSRVADEGLFDTLVALRKELGNDQDALGEMFPNSRALASFLSITGENAKKNEEIFNSLATATGATDRAFKGASETLEFQMAAAMSELQAIGIQFGEIMMPIFKRFIDGIKGVFDWLSELPEESKKIIAVGLAVAAAIGPLLKLVAFFTGPVGLAIAAIVAGAVLIAKNWKTVGPPIMEALGAVKEFVIGLWEALGPFLKQLATDFFTFAAAVGKWLGDMWTKLEPVRNAIVSFAKEIWEGLVKAFQTLVDVWNADLKPALSDLWDALQALWDPLLKDLVIAIGLVVAGILWLAVKALPIVIKALGVFIRVVAAIIKVVAQVVQAIVKWFQDVLVPGIVAAFNAIKGPVQVVWDAIVTGAQFVWNILKTVFNAIKAVVVTVFNAMKVPVKVFFAFVKVWLMIIKGVWTVIWTNIKTVTKIIFGAIKIIVKAVWDFIRDTFNTMKGALITGWRLIKSVANTVWDAIKGFVQPVIDVIKNLITTVKNGVVGAWNWARDHVGPAIDFIIGKLETLIGWAQKAIDTLVEIFTLGQADTGTYNGPTWPGGMHDTPPPTTPDGKVVPGSTERIPVQTSVAPEVISNTRPVQMRIVDWRYGMAELSRELDWNDWSPR